MTVTGTEQRVYGTLVSPCFIDLHRIALVIGSIDTPPSQNMDILDRFYTYHIYADVPYHYFFYDGDTYCEQLNYTNNFTWHTTYGLVYDGVLTIALGHCDVGGVWVTMAYVEIRMCRSYGNRLVFDTYGVSTVPSLGSTPFAVWLNTAKYDEPPNWIVINNGTANAIMKHKSESFVIPKANVHRVYLPHLGIYNHTTIDVSLCCRKCVSPCHCGTCDKFGQRIKIESKRISVASVCCNYITVSISDVDWNGSNALQTKLKPKYGFNIYIFDNIIIEYTLICDPKQINIWAYFLTTPLHLYGEYIIISYYTEDDEYDIMYEGFSHMCGE